MVRRRRPRTLSAEERTLWERVKSATRPLDPTAAASIEAVSASLPAEPPPPAPPKLPPMPARTATALPSIAASAAPQMDRGRFERLRRGRLDPEARLDLHGLTAERAHAALSGFIVAAHADGLRLVLVITGKGQGGRGDGDAFALGPYRHGILRHSVPHWLAAPPLRARILDVVPAHNRHGGAGALYVYLRRRRDG